MNLRLLVLVVLVGCTGTSIRAQQGTSGSGSLSWQRARSPFTPASDAGIIFGGPGNDPRPGSPMYICRALFQGSLVPGKWVQGNCNVAYAGLEHIMQSYELAYGTARWRLYRGNSYGLVQTGTEADGTPLYSCRIDSGGFQPGKLVAGGTCNVPLGGREVIQNAPFEVLYGSDRPPYPYPLPPFVRPDLMPLPGCKGTDIDVSLNRTSGHWEGPNCSPSDGFGNITGPIKYASRLPSPDQQSTYQPAPQPYQHGPSSVSWQPVQGPFSPTQTAIMGGPGNGPKPGAPLYICRARVDNALYPGKWIEGQCSVVDSGSKEQKCNSYEVANGNAVWKNFDGNVDALVPGGYGPDGSPQYICRKQLNFMGNKGLQPGRLENGECHVSYAGIDHVSRPPFESLYNVFSGDESSQPR